ncbi:alpha-xenorhabdolysin family binary toxin subunit A [Shewanella sp. YLB-07]|uniref:alpha-xenorhabdolysin family binary toxin subunit A n=1 Tax=Shewanella sp. YLB-07 TaxID=2601268 RepID=UPI00128C03D9|nr:alpha-xenorhabdolysin family binary toxin subunit A [Shewanella sp. YLB-07]
MSVNIQTQLLSADVDYEIRNTQAMHELVKLATGKVEGTSSDISLVLDTEAILSLERYKVRGVTLPETAAEVRLFLGNYDSTIPGLANHDLLITYLAIRTNAKQWDPIKDELLKTAVEMDGFANKILTSGGQALNFLMDMVGIYYTGDIELDSITPEQMLDAEFVEQFMLDINDDAAAAEDNAGKLAITAGMIQSLCSQADIYYKSSLNLRDQILGFKTGMEACNYDVKKKEALCDQLDLDEQLQGLKKERRDLAAQIQGLKADYDKNVGLAFTGAVGGFIGIAITGGIFGAKAEKIKKEIAVNTSKLHDLDIEIEGLSKMLNAVTTVDGQLEGVMAVITQAEKGANQLVTAWLTVVDLLESSHNACVAIESSQNLVDYWVAFNDVVTPWNDVQSSVLVILEQINNALDQTLRMTPQYNLDYIQATKDSQMIHPSIDIKQLNLLAAKIREENNTIVNNYYPDFNFFCNAITERVLDAKADVKASIITVENNTGASQTSSINMINTFIINDLYALSHETDQTVIDSLNMKIDGFRTTVIKKLHTINALLQSRADLHKESIGNINYFNFKSDLIHEKEELTEKIALKELQILQIKTEINDTDQQINDLNKAKNLMRQYSVFDFFSDTIPSIDDIAGVADIPTPQLQAIALGLDILSGLVGEIGSGFSYNKMVDATIYLHKVLDELNAANKDLESEQDTYLISLDTINIMFNIESDRRPFCVELQNLMQCYQNFIVDINDAETLARDFNKQLELLAKMSSYMSELKVDIDSRLSITSQKSLRTGMYFNNIKGICERSVVKLDIINIKSASDLLKYGCQPKGRGTIAKLVGIDEAELLNWINRADLSRIRGVDAEYADLLEISGVDTVVELAQRDAVNLLKKLTQLNQEKSLIETLPSLSLVQKWIDEARSLPRAIHY